MFKLVCAYIMLIIGLAAINAHAQDVPAGRWWRMPHVVQQLQLTGDEVQRLEKAYLHSRREMIKFKSRVEAEQFELETLVESQKINEEEIKTQHRKLEKARSDLAAARFNFVVQARKIIGHARFQRLLKLHRPPKPPIRRVLPQRPKG